MSWKYNPQPINQYDPQTDIDHNMYHARHPPMGPGNQPIMQKNLFVRILYKDVHPRMRPLLDTQGNPTPIMVIDENFTVPYKLSLNGLINGYVKELILYQYAIKGVVINNNSPEHSYFDISIRHGTESMNWMRHDGKHAAPLVLTGMDTMVNLSVPIHIAEPSMHKHNGTYTIDIRDPDDNPPLFTEINLWFTIKF